MRATTRRRRSMWVVMTPTCIAVTIAALVAPARAALIESAWNTGDGGWSADGNWDPTIVPDNAADTYNVTINRDPGATVTLDTTPTIENLDVGVGNTLRFNNSQDLFVNGDVANDGTILINGTGLFTDLVSNAGDLAFTGTGTVQMVGTPSRVVVASSGNTITNGDGHTIRGAGKLGDNGANLVNHGSIIADTSGPSLTVDPIGTFTNHGTLAAENSSRLQLNAGNYDNTNGTITATGAGSDVRLVAGTNLTGGTLNASGGATVFVDGNATLTNITNQGQVTIDNGVDPLLVNTLTNHGDFLQDGTGSATDVRINGDVTVDGTGTWTLNDAAPTVNRILGISVTDVLTNANGHTIQGAGNIGANTLGLANRGLIDANATNPLVIDPSPTADADGNGNAVHNTGTGVFRASNGGTLRLQGGAFRNDNVIEALAGSRVEFNGTTTLTGGTVTTAGDGVVAITGNTVTLDTVTNTGDLTIENGIDPVFVGTITNQGTIHHNGTGATTDARVSGDVTLTGNGTWTLNDAGLNVNRILGLAADSVLTHDALHTIRGSGAVGGNNTGVINHGLIHADSGSGNVLVLEPSDADVDGNGANFHNTTTGLLRASNGGTLRLQGGVFRSDNVIEASDGSRVELQGTSTIRGGTFSTTGNGVVALVGNTVTLDGVTNDGQLDIDNGIDPILVGTFTNNDAVGQNGVSLNTDTRIDGDVLLTGSGVWTLGDAPATVNRVFATNGTAILTNDTDHAIGGAGSIGVGSMGLVNRGTVSATGTNRLVIQPSDTDADGNGADVFNAAAGVLQAVDGGTLQLRQGVFRNAGTLRATDGSAVELSTGTDLDGTVTTTGTGVIRVVGQNVVLRSLTNDADLLILNDIDPRLTGTFTNNQAVTQRGINSNTDTVLVGNVTLSGNGTWTLFDQPTTLNRFLGDSGTEVLTNTNAHTIRGAGSIGANTLGVVNNGGRIFADGDNALLIDPADVSLDADGSDFVQWGDLGASGTGGLVLQGGRFAFKAFSTTTVDPGSSLTVGADATMVLEDMADLAHTRLANQNGVFTVANRGTLVNESATFSPGSSFSGDPVINEITVENGGTFTNDADAAVTFDFAVNETDGILPGVTFDTIRGGGTFNLAGTLDLRFTDGTSPGLYEPIDLILDTSGGDITGTFDLAFDPFVGVGEAWAITYETNAFGVNAVRFTRALPGDANLNGQVEQGDLDAVLQNWGSTTNPAWNTGDLNGNGQVEQGDLDAVLQNWGSAIAPDLRGTALPEPTAVASVLLTLLAGSRHNLRRS